MDTPFDATLTVNVAVDASADDIEQAVRPYIDAGATRVPVCGDDADGNPDGSDRLLRLVDAVAEVRRRLS